MASAEFDENSEDKKPTVQVGDPFTEKLLLEACLELMKDDSIIAIQDMGAADLLALRWLQKVLLVLNLSWTKFLAEKKI